jgi:cyclic beta-1,2-glucan synthetase
VRHGRGYTRFEHSCHGVSHTLDWFVAADAPVRIVRVRLENLTKRTRHLSVTHFIEWALGDSRSKAQQQVVTWWDDAERMLMAHNYFNFDFPGRPAFLASDCEVDSCTASRTEFPRRNAPTQARRFKRTIPRQLRRDHAKAHVGAGGNGRGCVLPRPDRNRRRGARTHSTVPR